MAQEHNSEVGMQVNDAGAVVKQKAMVGVSVPVLILCCLLVAAVVGLSVALVMLNSRGEAPPAVEASKDVTSGRGTLVTPENVQELIAAEPVTNTDAAYTVSMSIDWSFEDGTSLSRNAYVENHVSNSRTVYFDLMLADTLELVYSSPYIPVGSTLQDFALDKDLEAGDYLAIVEYHLVDDDHNELSTVSVTVNLHILN